MVAIKRRITIIGAGLSGSLLALLLGQRGYGVDVYERRSDMRIFGFKGGRSINLALSDRGLLALEMAGIREEVLEMVISMRGRQIHNEDGTLAFQPYGKDQTQVINSISRADLNIFLLKLADRLENTKFYFDHKCVAYDTRKNILEIQNERGTFTVEPELVIGADGANSVIRQSMLHRPMFNYSQEFLDWGYKELEIPSDHDGGFRIEPHALHIWPRKQFVMIALPNKNGSFTVTLFAPYKGEYGFESLMVEDDVRNFFSTHFSDAVPHLPDLTEQFFENPIGRLVTIKCSPWAIDDKAVLLGDAAHAIIPFYGQGMNAAFEDVRILVELLETKPSYQEVLQEFSSTRKENADAIAELSYENFVEMRDKVADPEFLRRKKAETELYEAYPDEIISKYAMVTFNPQLPYVTALKKGNILENTIEELFSDDSIEYKKETSRELVLRRYKDMEK